MAFKLREEKQINSDKYLESSKQILLYFTPL